jgi:hypothetical protein
MKKIKIEYRNDAKKLKFTSVYATQIFSALSMKLGAVKNETNILMRSSKTSIQSY